MSNLGMVGDPRQRNCQLPVHAYFDQDIFASEINTLFNPGLGYVGHQLMVPQLGDYHCLDWDGGGRVLTCHQHGVELLSNVCQHRQALILQGRGNAQNIVCPLHRWTYQMDGRLLGAPHFDSQPCLDLPRYPLSNWNGLLFSGKRPIAQELNTWAQNDRLRFDNYRYHKTEVRECHYNWKTFIEVYLEDYHVDPFHPGLGRFVDCNTLKWEWGETFSLQTVGIHKNLSQPGTPVYRTWHDQILRYSGDNPPQFGAIWMTLFPNLMIEQYPHEMVVSLLIPRGPQHTTNIVEFYYPEEIVLFEPEFMEAGQKAYAETGDEDDEIALRMDAGRLALWRRNENQTGPYLSPYEDGMVHFHEYLRSVLPTQYTAPLPPTPASLGYAKPSFLTSNIRG